MIDIVWNLVYIWAGIILTNWEQPCTRDACVVCLVSSSNHKVQCHGVTAADGGKQMIRRLKCVKLKWLYLYAYICRYSINNLKYSAFVALLPISVERILLDVRLFLQWKVNPPFTVMPSSLVYIYRRLEIIRIPFLGLTSKLSSLPDYLLILVCLFVWVAFQPWWYSNKFLNIIYVVLL
jgi:hypothetical protein